MAKFIPGVTKRNPTATIERDLARAKALQAEAPPPVVVEHIPGATMAHFGVDDPDAGTGHGIMPVRAASSADWEATALAIPEARAEADKALNLEHLMRECDDRPKRVEARERVIAEREALAALTGVAFTPASRSDEQRFQMARFMDAFAEAELAFKEPARELKLRAIVADAERILRDAFQYDIRRVQAIVIERFKA